MNRYQEAGVDVNAGYELVHRIKDAVKSTDRPGMMTGIGSFGGMFNLSALHVKHPVLVSGTDGVGTKLLLAQQLDKHDTIGIDVVAMCVNDVLAQGAEPLYFLDYIATGHNDPAKMAAIVKGVAAGCSGGGLSCPVWNSLPGDRPVRPAEASGGSDHRPVLRELQPAGRLLPDG